MKRLLFVSGRPGIGKTTVVLNAARELKTLGYNVGGMVSREVRQQGSRIGFEIIDFESGERGWLAHVNQPTGPQVGRYRVNLRDLDSIGVKAIQTALARAQAVIIDEIGPMELSSQAFAKAVREAIGSGKLILGVIHHSARHQIIETIKKRDDADIETVTFENRSKLHNLLIQNALQYLHAGQSQG